MALQIKKLGKYVGAEITGIDLRQPQDMKIKTAINKALSDHVAIVVRGQNFTPQEYVEATKVLGDPFPQNFTDYNHPDVEIINIVSNQHRDDEGKRIKRGGNWHTDHTNHECPRNLQSCMWLMCRDTAVIQQFVICKRHTSTCLII